MICDMINNRTSRTLALVTVAAAAAVLILCIIPSSDGAVNDSGVTGDCTWALSDDGVLTVSGTGAMENYDSCTDAPWHVSEASIRSVVISDGVTAVGDCAFEGCASLTHVRFGAGLEVLGQNSFPYSFYNGNVQITDAGDLQNHGFMLRNEAFVIWNEHSGTTGDCTWTLNSGTLVISGNGAMADYNAASGAPWYAYRSTISTVSVSEGVTSIGSHAFHGCSNLTTACMGDSVTVIGSHAFHGCSALESIFLSDSVTMIGDYAFYNCSSLASATLGDSVTSIGIQAFAYCTSLSAVVLPDTVTSIGDGAFMGCTALASASLGDSVTSIGSSAFRGCSALTSADIPGSVTLIGDHAFWGCDALNGASTEAEIASYDDEIQTIDLMDLEIPEVALEEEVPAAEQNETSASGPTLDGSATATTGQHSADTSSVLVWIVCAVIALIVVAIASVDVAHISARAGHRAF